MYKQLLIDKFVSLLLLNHSIKILLDYVVIKGKDTKSCVKLAMRSKITGLVAFEKKKLNQSLRTDIED